MLGNGNVPEKQSRRIFFAAFPNKMTQKKLIREAEEIQAMCGGRVIKAHHVHLTLLFLGDTNMDRIDTLLETMKKISVKRFELELNKISYWKHNQIVFAGASHYPDELFVLVESLKNSLTEAGFLFDNRNYKPHITLIRKAFRPIDNQPMKPVLWSIGQWHLVQSKSGPEGADYISLAHWPLK
ncbi:RNA 2',3'-cyclic phosphodiesterase [Nitrosomonas sp. sh817]|nr:RNA 2',3'-cyclic phosphodiesterase [Nitrosomonas sp. sh817]